MYFLSGYDTSTLSIYQKTTITNKVYQYFSLKNKTYCSLLERLSFVTYSCCLKLTQIHVCCIHFKRNMIVVMGPSLTDELLNANVRQVSI